MLLADNLAAFLSPERVSVKPADLELAAHDESSCSPSLPDVVVWPLTTDEVSRVVGYAYAHDIPLTARGAGSSLEGNPIPVRGGIVLDLGTRCRKTSSGYHLIGLLVGSEGTLAIATELTLSLVGLPQGRKQGAFTFPSEKAAVTAIATMMRYGVDLAAVEFLDRRSVAALNRFQGFGLEEQPSLFIEVHGSPALVDEVFATACALCEEHEGTLIVLPGGRNPWEIRHFTTRAIQALNPQAKTIRTDMGFPISRLPEVVEQSYAIAERHQVVLHTLGHAGLGILHALLREDPADTA